jgi:hypothetical protein
MEKRARGKWRGLRRGEGGVGKERGVYMEMRASDRGK